MGKISFLSMFATVMMSRTRKEDEEERQAREKEEVKKLEEELQKLEVDGAPARVDDESKEEEAADDEGWVFD